MLIPLSHIHSGPPGHPPAAKRLAEVAGENAQQRSWKQGYIRGPRSPRTWGMQWLRSLGGTSSACTHVPDSLPAPSGSRCEECPSTHSLRMCATCGHVGCCESQAGHARRHAATAKHPVIIAMPTDRGFTWCYVENTYVR